jgi:hypothetical protein
MVKRLEADLRERVSAEPAAERLLREQHAAAKRGQRTGVPFETWRDQQLTQVAAGWVLACVFTRFCEDNRLLPDPWLAGPGDRLVEARERQTAWRQSPMQAKICDVILGSTHGVALPTRDLPCQQAVVGDASSRVCKRIHRDRMMFL